uniref:Uncharacterized protein n=1 Tax=Ascaris lumbricoides TaxID=6252 RepID=A0A0M3I5X5_ASCLU
MPVKERCTEAVVAITVVIAEITSAKIQHRSRIQ